MIIEVRVTDGIDELSSSLYFMKTEKKKKLSGWNTEVKFYLVIFLIIMDWIHENVSSCPWLSFQTSKMNLFAKIVNDFQLLTISAKSSI